MFKHFNCYNSLMTQNCFIFLLAIDYFHFIGISKIYRGDFDAGKNTSIKYVAFSSSET